MGMSTRSYTSAEVYDALAPLMSEAVAKMVSTAHKGHWRKATVEHLVQRVREEIAEFWRAVDVLDADTGDGTLELFAEMADIVNTLMMLRDKLTDDRAVWDGQRGA
jgi:hypothetical protein